MFTILAGISALCLLVAAVCSVMAMVSYLRTPGATLIGFGFARYFYGDLRREKPALFFGTLGGVIIGIALNFVAVALLH